MTPLSELPLHPSADRFEDLPAEEQELVRTTAREMNSLVFHYAVPVTLSLTTEPWDSGALNTGSAALVRFEGQTFALTAAHVVQRVEDRQSEGEPVGLFLAETLIETPERVHWVDEANDLALVTVTEEEATQVGTWVYEFRPDDTPLVPPVHVYVLFVGFPRALRSRDAQGNTVWGAQSSLLRVTTSGSAHFNCRFEREEWISTHGDEIPPPGSNQGGLSGGPVFLVGKLHFPLVGVVTDFHDAFEGLEVLRVQSTNVLPFF